VLLEQMLRLPILELRVQQYLILPFPKALLALLGHKGRSEIRAQLD
jgi:hypothetical protein